MKILLITAGITANGSTKRAVREAADVLARYGADSEIFELGYEISASCSGCGGCAQSGECIHNDNAKRLADLISDFDGYIFFSPVHYGGATGALISALSRLFYSKRIELLYKPAAAIAVSRRGGNFTAIEEITRFFAFACMPTVTGNYPGIIHGTSYGEVEKDKEGLQTVRSITENLVWLLKCIHLAKKNGIEHPTPEPKIKTSYIREP